MTRRKWRAKILSLRMLLGTSLWHVASVELTGSGSNLHIRRLEEHDLHIPSLHQILSKSRSDKAAHHGYTRFYTPLFEPLRTKKTRLVEIGVEQGRSMKAWQIYFSNTQSHMFGIGSGNFQKTPTTTCDDASGTATKGSGAPCDLFHGDQSNATFLNTFIKQTGGRFDIIIDDGSHVPDHQRISFESLWPAVVPGGLYAIEDVETSYWHDSASIYGYNLSGQRSIVEHMTAVANVINREFLLGKSPLPAVYSDVSTIMFAQNLIVLRKQTALEQKHYFNRTYRMANELG